MVYLIDTENVSSQFWMNIKLNDGDEIILFVSKKSKPLALTDMAEVAKGISDGNIHVVKTIDAKKKNLMDTEILCYLTNELTESPSHFTIVSDDTIYEIVTEFMKSILDNNNFSKVSFIRPNTPQESDEDTVLDPDDLSFTRVPCISSNVPQESDETTEDDSKINDYASYNLIEKGVDSINSLIEIYKNSAIFKEETNNLREYNDVMNNNSSLYIRAQINLLVWVQIYHNITIQYEHNRDEIKKKIYTSFPALPLPNITWFHARLLPHLRYIRLFNIKQEDMISKNYY